MKVVLERWSQDSASANTSAPCNAAALCRIGATNVTSYMYNCTKRCAPPIAEVLGDGI